MSCASFGASAMTHTAAVPGPIGYGEERERHYLHTLPAGRPSFQHRSKAWYKGMKKRGVARIYEDPHKRRETRLWRNAEQQMMKEKKHTRLFTFLACHRGKCTTYSVRVGHITSRVHMAHQSGQDRHRRVRARSHERDAPTKCHTRDYIPRDPFARQNGKRTENLLSFTWSPLVPNRITR